MTAGQRSGAPRLIEWTGERCVPWAPDVQVVYEHLHRYMWARELVAGRRVLDLASGEGFGAAILKQSAATVEGVDLDGRTVDHSALNYGGDGISFRRGDAQDLSELADDTFGAVVAFEMIEHVENQARVLAEIARVLEPGGIVIMSTPDRRAYSEATGNVNPFHLRELDYGEFESLLRGTFAQVRLWGQRTITGSAISAMGERDAVGSPALTFFVDRRGDAWEAAEGLSPTYLMAVACNHELPLIPAESTLADAGLALVRHAERQQAAQAAQAGQAAQERMRIADEASLEELTQARESAALDRDRADQLQDALAQLRRTVSERDAEIDLWRVRIKQLSEKAQLDAQSISELEARRAAADDLLSSASLRAADAFRRRVYARLGGPQSLRSRVLRAGVHRGRQIVTPPAPERPQPVLELPQFDDPRVSIVIPLFAGAELTRAALQSIRDNTTKVSYEVILVNDGTDSDTVALLESVRGARILVNDTNLGYLRSVNRGAGVARGEWLALCNNDIEVLEGWLTSMLECGASGDDIAIVTPKYLAADWSLSEAGGVIWNDATGGNYGRGASPGEFRFEFRRDVDYGSAAALLVRADFWREVGGFDERFMPMYYEDTDLCFQARERGRRVMYEPRANVVHLEGSTAGTDTSVGHKRWQEVNRLKFAAKWANQLPEQPPASRSNLRRAADRRHGPRLLIVDHRIPMWDRDSGSLRLRGMIDALTAFGWRITLLPDDRHLVLPYAQELQELGVEIMYGEFDLEGELEALAPDLDAVLTCRPHATTKYLDVIRRLAPTVPVIYDTVDLHWLRESRRSVLLGGDSRSPLVVALREIELALVRATDAVLVVSEAEKRQVLKDVPDAAVYVVGNVNRIQADVPGPEGRRGVIFVGGFEHTPNVDAALLLVRELMPRVWRELGDVPVTIVGGSAPDEVNALSAPLVNVTGWVAEIGPLLDAARAMAAPLTYGAGLKGKVTQALAAGLPVVTTPVGADGLDAVDGQQLLVAADLDGQAERLVSVLRDDVLWRRLSHEGQKLAEERWAPGVIEQRLTDVLEGLGLPVRSA